MAGAGLKEGHVSIHDLFLRDQMVKAADHVAKVLPVVVRPVGEDDDWQCAVGEV
jgi:hypothetical protein